MAELLAVVYRDPGVAGLVRDGLLRSRVKDLAQIADIVMAECEGDGRLALRQSHTTAAAGPVGHTLWGGLIGLIFFMPLVNVALATAGGESPAPVTGPGGDDTFLPRLAEALTPGSAAVFVLAVPAAPRRLLDTLAPYGGRIVSTTLGHAAERQLRDALAVVRPRH
ncbi:DUF1269 domain-containing protein [Spongiactinospora sp. 9N601]|uniref:DUF1269 domain-containing protein n=1 Tax=Spongiactinospora sp. 9N601 TaxID=3375149 RepID=UPI0037B3690B